MSTASSLPAAGTLPLLLGPSSSPLGDYSRCHTVLQHPDMVILSDPTGFSWHGDFQNGWDPTFQAAIDNCVS